MKCVPEEKRQARMAAFRAFRDQMMGKRDQESVADVVEDALNSLGLREFVEYVQEAVEDYLDEMARKHKVAH